MIQKIYVPLEERPRCKIDGCNKPRENIGKYRKDGTMMFRDYCSFHHTKRGKVWKELLKKIDINDAPKCGVEICNQKTVLYGTNIDGNPLYYTYCPSHSKLSAPYLAYRKDYCENIDGRLGFTCTSNIAWIGMLDVDHKDGNPHNNNLDNLQTLCKCCHAYKSWNNEDWKTPGRKTGKVSNASK